MKSKIQVQRAIFPKTFAVHIDCFALYMKAPEEQNEEPNSSTNRVVQKYKR